MNIKFKKGRFIAKEGKMVAIGSSRNAARMGIFNQLDTATIAKRLFDKYGIKTEV